LCEAESYARQYFQVSLEIGKVEKWSVGAMDDDLLQTLLDLFPPDTAEPSQLRFAVGMFSYADMLVTCSVHVDASNTSEEVTQMGGVVSMGIPRLGTLHASLQPSLQPSSLPCSADSPVLRFMAGTFTYADMLATCGVYLDASNTSEEVTQMGDVVAVGIPRLGTLHALLQPL